ncbi:tRNA (uracil-5-)-methyltransferase homolog A-like [Watersipora subatra]|uniref:tRNA (uracil-5-)-methyltransferase homolog A-like n=1 Tax=Watersipora subatra TaxID=2589382 RepID=UPI00355B9B49
MESVEASAITSVQKADEELKSTVDSLKLPRDSSPNKIEDMVSTTTPSDRPILYSTEHFKIRIGNLHPRTAHVQIKQKLSSLKLKPKKIKKMDRCDWAFATFGCEEDRQEAMKILDGIEWRGKKISVKKAEAAADPLLERKRRADETHDDGVAKQQALNLTQEDYNKKILEKTCPLWHMTYSEQLTHKESKIRKVLSNLKEQMLRAYKDSPMPRSEYPSTDYHGLLSPISPSPKTESYRNKCEFTVGRHPISGDITVGYRLGEYKEGTVAVLNPTDLPNTSQSMKDIVADFQKYVTASGHAPFDPVSQNGHWMWLLIRTTSLGDTMVMPTFVQQELSEAEVSIVTEELVKHYSEGDGKSYGVTSLYIHITPRQKKSDSLTAPPKHLWGKETIEEVLLNLKFQISPSAFFQVNREGAEVLYSAIGEFAGLSDSTSTLLDVCCGTGTIGMLLASKAKSVIGIELVEQAVEDARKNAQLNGVENITFQCGRAEKLIPSLMQTMMEEPVAIVDPPRAGLNREVLAALRKDERLKKVVYVSCDPQNALKNFVELMRPTSKRWKGEPFKLVKLLPVDMFPLSNQCELVLLFERGVPIC